MSHVEVQLELVRVRTELDRLDLLGALEVDPGLDEVLGEDPALEQELVVLLQRIEDGGQGGRDLRDVGVLLSVFRARWTDPMAELERRTEAGRPRTGRYLR